MSKTNNWESDLLNLLFCNLAATGIGDAGGLLPSSVAGSLYISLHTADPGEAPATGQSTSEATFTGYARQGVVRSAGTWTVSGTAPSQAQNTAAITWSVCTAGSSLVSHFGIGTDVSGAGKLLYSGTLTPNITIASGITAQIPALGLSAQED